MHIQYSRCGQKIPSYNITFIIVHYELIKFSMCCHMERKTPSSFIVRRYILIDKQDADNKSNRSVIFNHI